MSHRGTWPSPASAFPGASLRAASTRLQGPQGRHMKCGPAAVPSLSLPGAHLMEDSFPWTGGGRGGTLSGRFKGIIFIVHFMSTDFPGGSDGKGSSCSAGDVGSIPGPGISPGERTGNPPQYSRPENSMDRGGLQSMGWKRETRLSDQHFCFMSIVTTSPPPPVIRR